MKGRQAVVLAVLFVALAALSLAVAAAPRAFPHWLSRAPTWWWPIGAVLYAGVWVSRARRWRR